MSGDYGFVLKRRDPPPDPPSFRCVGCKELIQPAGNWRHRSRIEKPPVCIACARHWGAGFGYNVPSATYGDRCLMQRLIAVVTMINWEVKNARWAKQ